MGDSAGSGFQCNICGSRNATLPGAWDREVPSCATCGSTIRTRSLMQALSQELFGTTIPVRDFPRLRGLRGIGMSDSADYAEILADRFDYKNTWYHRDPRLDITNIPDSEAGQYDFVLSSEVLEHVSPPVEEACRNLCRLLRPNGVLLLTVPFLNTPETREHFPNLHQFAIASLGDTLVLLNRTRDGDIEVHENLVFHGGPGSTLEMRLFSDRHLRQALLDGGFREVQFYPGPAAEWGILHPGDWSLPLAARKEPFSLRQSCTADWAVQSAAGAAQIRSQQDEMRHLRAEADARTQWAQRLDRELETAAERLRILETELERRTAWAQDLDRQLSERTQWALSLQRDVEEQVRRTEEVRAESEQSRRRLMEIENRRAVRLARRLGLA